MRDLDRRLELAGRKRDALAAKLERLTARRDSAQYELERIREECRSHDLDPGKIDEIREKLREKIAVEITEFKRAVDELEKNLNRAA